MHVASNPCVPWGIADGIETQVGHGLSQVKVKVYQSVLKFGTSQASVIKMVEQPRSGSNSSQQASLTAKHEAAMHSDELSNRSLELNHHLNDFGSESKLDVIIENGSEEETQGVSSVHVHRLGETVMSTQSVTGVSGSAMRHRSRGQKPRVRVQLSSSTSDQRVHIQNSVQARCESSAASGGADARDEREPAQVARYAEDDDDGNEDALPGPRVIRSPSTSAAAAPVSHEKVEKAQSQVGSNTTGSSIGYNAALQSVRQLALSEDAPMEPSIKCLQRFIRLTFAVVLVMSVVGFAVVHSSGASLEQSVQNIVNAGELRTEILKFRLSLSSFLLVSEGLLPFMPPDFEAADRQNMRNSVRQAFELHKSLYLEKASPSGELEKLYSEPILSMESLVSSSVLETRSNLWDGVNRVLSAASRIIETPLLQVNDRNADVFLLQENTAFDAPVFAALMRVIELYQDQAENNTQSVITTQAVLMAVAIGIMAVFVLGVLPPVMRHVNRTAHRVFELFLDINQLQIMEIARSREEVLVALGVGTEFGGNTLKSAVCVCLALCILYQFATYVAVHLCFMMRRG